MPVYTDHHNRNTISVTGADLVLHYVDTVTADHLVVNLSSKALPELSKVGRAILSVGRENYPETIQQRLFAEIACRLRLGCDGDATSHSLLALTGLHAALEPAIGRLGQKGCVRIEVDHGSKSGFTISTGNDLELENRKNPASKLARGSSASSGTSNDLCIEVQIDGWSQYMTIPRNLIKQRVNRLEKEVVQYRADSAERSMAFIVFSFARLRQKALIGDVAGIPASTLDMVDVEKRVTGAVCWLLDHHGLLSAATSGTVGWLAKLAFEAGDEALYEVSLHQRPSPSVSTMAKSFH